MRRPWSPLTVVALLALQGCYVYAPLHTSTPPTGETVVLQISDRGRLALGERLGPGVLRIQGRVTSVADEMVSLNVFSVRYVTGDKSLWSGESMTMSREYVSNVEVKRLSKSRTWVAVGATTVVVGAFVFSRGLRAWLTNLPNEPGGDGEGPTSFRLKLGFHF